MTVVCFVDPPLIVSNCLMACALQREDGCETAHFAAFVARPLRSSLECPVFPSWARWRQCERFFLDERDNSEPFFFSQQQWMDCRIRTDGARGGHGFRHVRANPQFIQFQLCCAQCGSSQSRSIQLGNNAETRHGSGRGSRPGNCGMHLAGLRRKHLGL